MLNLKQNSKKLPIGEISGIISVVKDEKGNDKILISANEKRQILTNLSQTNFLKKSNKNKTIDGA